MPIELVMPPSHLILCRPLLLLPQSLPAWGSFPVSQFFPWGGQSTGVSALVLPMNTQDWSPLGWTGWISLQSKGLSRCTIFFLLNICPDTCLGVGLLDHMVVLFSRVLPSPCLQGAKAIYLINCTLGKEKYYKFSALLNTIQSWPKCNQGFSVGMGPLNTRPMLWSIIQSSKRCVY